MLTAVVAGLPIAASTQAPTASTRATTAARATAPTPAAPSAVAASLQQLNIREATLAARIGAARNRLARLYSALQRYSRDPPPPLLTPPNEALDSVRAAILIRALTPSLERQVHTLQGEHRALIAQRRVAAAANGERFAAESAQADLQRVDGLIAASQGPGSARGAPPRLSAPVEGEPDARFGGQLAGGGASRGWEYAPSAATPVASPAAGVVEYAGPLDGWGRVLILRGPGGYHIVLAGLSTLVVQPGQSVASGQTIGAMPMSDTPAPHLYLEVRQGDDPVDPAPLLAQTRR